MNKLVEQENDERNRWVRSGNEPTGEGFSGRFYRKAGSFWDAVEGINGRDTRSTKADEIPYT